MSKDKGKDKKEKTPLLYESKDLKIFVDQNHASESEIHYISKQDPIERIRETVQLILRVFPLNEKKPNTDKIYIDKS